MKNSIEIVIGIIVLSVCIIFTTHFFRTINLDNRSGKFSQIFYAKFNNIDGIKIGTDVKIGGQKTGEVRSLHLNPNTFQIEVKIAVQNDIKIPKDSVLSVTSSGFFGSKFLTIKPGSDDDFLAINDTFDNTQSSVNIEDLISKFVTSSSEGKSKR